MSANTKTFLACFLIAGVVVLASASASTAQRYEPSRPTVSPYLNLFQNNRNNGQFNRALPNYYSLVRPQLQQNQFNQAQRQLQQQQNQSIQELQASVGSLVQQQQAGQAVLTGHNSWFTNPGSRARFRDTSQYFSRVEKTGAGKR